MAHERLHAGEDARAEAPPRGVLRWVRALWPFGGSGDDVWSIDLDRLTVRSRDGSAPTVVPTDEIASVEVLRGELRVHAAATVTLRMPTVDIVSAEWLGHAIASVAHAARRRGRVGPADAPPEMTGINPDTV